MRIVLRYPPETSYYNYNDNHIEVPFKEEMINFHKFVRGNKVFYGGATKKVQKLLDIPFNGIDSMRSNIQYREGRVTWLLSKNNSLEIKIDSLKRKRTFLERLKILFTGRV